MVSGYWLFSSHKPSRNFSRASHQRRLRTNHHLTGQRLLNTLLVFTQSNAAYSSRVFHKCIQRAFAVDNQPTAANRKGKDFSSLLESMGHFSTRIHYIRPDKLILTYQCKFSCEKARFINVSK